jgi:DNA-binding NarL/FixJ family response regulator
VLDNGGADACRRLREQSPSIGIIVVGASGTDEDEWRALEAGADDCVVAPFRYREIVARMSAVLRRPPVAKTKSRSSLRVGSIELDLNTPIECGAMAIRYSSVPQRVRSPGRPDGEQRGRVDSQQTGPQCVG